MDETLLLVQKIKAMYNTRTFSKSDNAIAEYILANPPASPALRPTRLPRRPGQARQVIRFCRKLGFGGFMELKNSAANYIVETARTRAGLRRGDDVRTVKNKVINYTKLIMDELGEMLDDSALEEAARLISEAKESCDRQRGRLRHDKPRRVRYLPQARHPLPLHRGPHLPGHGDKHDGQGRPAPHHRELRPHLERPTERQLRQERGIKIVGIVGPANSPLSKYLDVEI